MLVSLSVIIFPMFVNVESCSSDFRDSLVVSPIYHAFVIAVDQFVCLLPVTPSTLLLPIHLTPHLHIRTSTHSHIFWRW